MRAKHCILILCCIVVTTILFVILGPAGESIVTQTHQQINNLQDTLRVAETKQLEIDAKYLAILGFTNPLPTKVSNYNQYNIDIPAQQQQQKDAIVAIQQLPLRQNNGPEQPNAPSQVQNAQSQYRSGSNVKPSHTPRVTTTPYNTTKFNFSIVTYVQDGQAPSAILLAQNIAAKFPNEYLLIYDLGLSELESRALNAYCNSSKCTVITYDLSLFPSYVAEQRMHAYRPIVIKDALMRSKVILFAENYMRIRGSTRELNELQNRVMVSGVLGWNTLTAVSTRTHPKMFEYFQKNAEEFYFLRMVDLDVALFTDSLYVTEKIMLPWLKCVLTVECIDPIGAQSHGCKYNKKPSYRYSGCHAYDVSAFNIVLGLTWHMDYAKYTLPSETHKIFYKETLEQATKILENRRRNSSETSEHAFTEE